VAKDKNKAPSRVRYEQANPTVSCRVSREIYDRLITIRKTQGKSFSDIMRLGLGLIEPEAVKENEAYGEGYGDGWRDGMRDGEQAYKVMYHCSICGELIELVSREEKLAASRYMEEHGWRHASCHEEAER
jgi:hypothetical protein